MAGFAAAVVRERGGTPQAPRIETLAIETMGGQGDGLAPGPVYVPFSLPGETVTVRVTGDRGELVEVLGAKSRPGHAALSALRPLRRLRAAALGERALSRVET